MIGLNAMLIWPAERPAWMQKVIQVSPPAIPEIRKNGRLLVEGEDYVIELGTLKVFNATNLDRIEVTLKASHEVSQR